MYYVMEQDTERSRAYMLGPVPSSTLPRNRWLDGTCLGEPPPAPLPLELDPADGTRMVDYFQGDIPVFAATLLDRFRAAGVDNLEAYPTVLLDPESGKQWTGYFAVNVIGAIRSADAAALAPAGARDDSVVPEAPAGFLCFRLLEDLSRIVVHDRVVSRVPVTDFRGLRFTRLELPG